MTKDLKRQTYANFTVRILVYMKVLQSGYDQDFIFAEDLLLEPIILGKFDAKNYRFVPFLLLIHPFLHFFPHLFRLYRRLLDCVLVLIVHALKMLQLIADLLAIGTLLGRVSWLVVAS